jgi:hypothetical protein
VLVQPTPSARASPVGSIAIRGPADDVLARRGLAVLHGSEAAFLADIDPGQGDLVARERMVFANLRQVQFATFRFARLSPTGSMNLVPDVATSLIVRLTYSVAGVDIGATSARYSYTVKLTGRHVLVTGIVPANELVGRQPLPWDEVPLTVSRAAGVLLATDETEPDGAALAEQAAAAAAAVRQLWGSRKAVPSFMAFVTRDDGRFRHWAGSAPSEAVGVELPLPAFDDTGFVGSRVVLSLDKIRPGSVPFTFRHELAHAVGVLVQNPHAAPWAEEGFARWFEVAQQPLRQEHEIAIVADAVANGQFTGELVGGRAFYDKFDLNYAVAYTVFRFVAERWGDQKAVDFFVSNIGSTTFDQATTSLFQMPGDAFLQQWQEYVRQLRP